MYIIKTTMLVQHKEDGDWMNASSVESSYFKNDFKDIRHDLVKEGQKVFKAMLHEHGIGNVFYQRTDNDLNKREILIHGEPLKLWRLEIKTINADDVRDTPHFDMGR